MQNDPPDDENPDDGTTKEMGNVELMNTGKWTPEQALLAALKHHEDFDHIVIACGLKNGTCATICANADAKDMIWAAEMVRMRATR